MSFEDNLNVKEQLKFSNTNCPPQQPNIDQINENFLKNHLVHGTSQSTTKFEVGK